MAEPIWYFADGDEERGPVTEAQIRTLIGTGNLKADDLVWREGMDDWLPARDVPGLFRPAAEPAAAPRPKPEPQTPPAEPRTGGPPPNPRPAVGWEPGRPLEIFRYVAFLGQPLLLAGLVMVVGSRGCASVADRYAERLESRAALAPQRFEAETRRQQARLQQQLSDLEERPTLTPAERSRRDRLEADLRELVTQRRAESQRLQAEAWQELEHEAGEARTASAMGNFWRSGIFWAGTLLLSLSLAIIGFTAQGPERWACLAILAAVVFNLLAGRPF